VTDAGGRFIHSPTPPGVASAALPAPEPGMLSALLDHIPGRVVVVGRDHRYLYVNREFLEFQGLQPEQALGRHVAELLGQAVFETYIPVAERLFAGESIRWEGWVEYPKQGRRYMQEHLLPYAPAGGRVEAVIAFGRELTELKERELELAAKLQELQTSEALKSAIVDHALVALITTDADGRVVEFNPAAETMFGRRRADTIGRRISELIMPERFRGPHEAGMRRMQSGGAPRVLGKRLELHALRADGSEFPIEMVLWRTDVSHAVLYTASIVDLTERQTSAREIERQRDALRQSEKLSAMGSLLAGVAHELNNPLAIVMGRASLLEEKCVEQAELPAAHLRNDAQLIREAAERCGRIVRTFLNMARSQPAERASVPLNDMVRAAVDMLQYGYRTHGIELDIQLGEALPPVMADPDQIGQIVLNLLVNAQQALAGRSGMRRVTVQTGVEPRRETREPRVWLRVVDNGPGVTEQLRSRIFEPYFTTKPEGHGTGIGLAVSRSMARDHGGELVLEPDRGDGGASFRLSLPISGIAEAESVPGALPVLGASLTARVLVVDDEVELSALMRDMLEAAGYDVATAESGMVALEMLATARFDAIVSDLRMPDMDGAALWRAVSKQHPSLARAMLFVTGDTLSPDAREFLRSTHCPALDKPFSKSDLLGKLADLLG
jgi:two-component system NtrC family sensor kinase